MSASPNRPLVIGGAISLGAAIVFGLIATQALKLSPLQQFDKETAQRMREYTQEERSLGWFMVGLTIAGGVTPMFTLAILGATWRFLRRERLLGAAWILIPLTGAILNLALKVSFDRPRPPEDWRDPFVDETNESFPSGHAMGSTIGFGVLAYMLCLQVKPGWRRGAITALMTLFIAGVGLSRVYLRAHWFSDVMAGFVIGAGWLALGIGVTEMLRRRKSAE